MGPGVEASNPNEVKPPTLSGAVGLAAAPTEAQTVYIQPRFGIVQLTTAGKQTTEVGAPGWQWPKPTLTMPAPTDLIGGHAPAWRAVAAAQAQIEAAQKAATAGQGGTVLPPPTVDLVGSQGRQTVPAAQLAWHRQAFADPEKLKAWLEKLNARARDGRAQPIQFYAHTIELGVIDPKGGPDGTARYADCFVAVEIRPMLVGGGFESEPVMIENKQVREVQAQYWKDCGFAEPVEEKFVFTRLKKIKMQLPQRRRNFLGFLHWLNGDWLDIVEDPDVSQVKPLNSLEYDTEAGFVAALENLRTQFKDKQPKLTLVKMGPDLRERVSAAYQQVGAEKE